ncbi:hypothetical protein PG995_007284 [Apiospora arundinis]
MNAPEGVVNFVPKQAVAPTPQLYDELVSDSMENLAKASLSLAEAIPNGAVINDNGCGTGAGTAAILDAVAGKSGISITVKGNDINDDALAVYRKRAAEHKWPAEGVHDDSNALQFGDCTFDLAIGNALLFVLPDDGIGAVKEVHRTLKPGGLAFFNSTRPEGTPLPRAGLEKWASADFLQSVVEKGGFKSDRISMHEVPVSVTTSEPNRYANMLWSFIGGTTPVGWLTSDEENWDKATGVIKEELKKTKGYKEIEGNRLQLQFVANIAVAKK